MITVDMYWGQPNGHSTYIFRTDVPHGGPAFHAAGTGASAHSQHREESGHTAIVGELQFASDLSESVPYVLLLYRSHVWAGHDCYPLAVKAEATLDSQSGAEDGSAALGSTNSNITQAVFEKDKVESDFDGNDLGKECVICLSEPRNTTVLPCQHMFVTGKDRRNNTSRVTKIFQHAISVDLILIEMAELGSNLYPDWKGVNTAPQVRTSFAGRAVDVIAIINKAVEVASRLVKPRKKGVKLGLESKVSDYSVGSGEFLVLVPYTKKDRQQDKKDETPASSSIPADPQTEAAWSDMMQDLSYLRSISRNDHQTKVILDETRSRDSDGHNCSVLLNCSSQVKRKRNNTDDKIEGHANELVLSILKSSSNDMDDEKAKIFVQVLASINCFTDPKSGSCMFEEVSGKYNISDPCLSGSDSCGCPTWLRSISKIFSFLNIYSASLQLQQGQVTYSSLKGALDRLCLFGFQAGVTNIEQLSLLCPKVVHIVDDDTVVRNFKDSIVIFRNLTTKGGQSAIQTTGLLSYDSFMTNFKDGVFIPFFLTRQNGNDFSKISLEDFITFVKQGGIGATSIDMKRAGSRSFEAKCCDTNPMTPLEMVEHLRKGIGSDGQVVHVENITVRNATYVEIPSELSESTILALKNIGITRLYSHQAESIQASLAGKNVVVATLTSSGKSLCYNVPVLEVLSQNLSACALYLFPTKVLCYMLSKLNC
ncbi:hypothetical protein CQW23_11813 [Capsicum baccatum]|uniref:Uncharacterized protein n=1 Tax=Capsicum baccatum TaxID=33114 RepID=A0A2G2WQT7_CAPBA|nr:hypothetical protein CQW23_11813 [Capsicum baccatum]